MTGAEWKVKLFDRVVPGCVGLCSGQFVLNLKYLV